MSNNTDEYDLDYSVSDLDELVTSLADALALAITRIQLRGETKASRREIDEARGMGVAYHLALAMARSLRSGKPVHHEYNEIDRAFQRIKAFVDEERDRGGVA